MPGIFVYNFCMLLFRVVRTLLIPLVAMTLWGQQPSSSSSSKSSTSDDSAQQQQQPSTEPADQQPVKPESKVKKELKNLEPQCIGITGGAGKCRHAEPAAANTKQEDQERELRQQCSDAATQAQPQCVGLRKSDSVRDTKVGDDYLSDKHYVSAVNRYCLALQEDPSNTIAKEHLAQALKKSGNKATGCEQLPQFQQQNTNDTKARETLKCAPSACGK